MSLLSFILTILGAVVIFYITTQLNLFFFEPNRELVKCKREICKVLSFNRNLYLNPGSVDKEKLLEISNEIRKVATKLLSIKNIPRRNKVFYILKKSIKEENISEAVKNLFGLANKIGKFSSKEEKEIIYGYENDIKKELNIRFE